MVGFWICLLVGLAGENLYLLEFSPASECPPPPPPAGNRSSPPTTDSTSHFKPRVLRISIGTNRLVINLTVVEGVLGIGQAIRGVPHNRGCWGFGGDLGGVVERGPEWWDPENPNLLK